MESKIQEGSSWDLCLVVVGNGRISQTPEASNRGLQVESVVLGDNGTALGTGGNG